MLRSMVHDLIVRIAAFDPSVQYLTVADCTYRFYRDTRFSSDKSPYKRHFGAYINARARSPTMADTTCTWNRKAVW